VGTRCPEGRTCGGDRSRELHPVDASAIEDDRAVSTLVSRAMTEAIDLVVDAANDDRRKRAGVPISPEMRRALHAAGQLFVEARDKSDRMPGDVTPIDTSEFPVTDRSLGCDPTLARLASSRADDDARGLEWPREIAPPGLPRIRTCGFPASGSSCCGFVQLRGLRIAS
jgi:hypothetical protein